VTASAYGGVARRRSGAPRYNRSLNLRRWNFAATYARQGLPSQWFSGEVNAVREAVIWRPVAIRACQPHAKHSNNPRLDRLTLHRVLRYAERPSRVGSMYKCGADDERRHSLCDGHEEICELVPRQYRAHGSVESQVATTRLPGRRDGERRQRRDVGLIVQRKAIRAGPAGGVLSTERTS
jgi:hypothetical protein